MNHRISSNLAILFVSLSALACGSDGHHSASALPCAGSPDCRNRTYAPNCADTATTACNMNVLNDQDTYGACVYRVNHLIPSCACVAGTVRYCNTGVGGDGTLPVQDCFQNAGGQSTTWGGCHG
jgi:hypothetical protein